MKLIGFPGLKDFQQLKGLVNRNFVSDSMVSSSIILVNSHLSVQKITVLRLNNFEAVRLTLNI